MAVDGLLLEPNNYTINENNTVCIIPMKDITNCIVSGYTESLNPITVCIIPCYTMRNI